MWHANLLIYKEVCDGAGCYRCLNKTGTLGNGSDVNMLFTLPNRHQSALLCTQKSMQCSPPLYKWNLTHEAPGRCRWISQFAKLIAR